MFFSKIFSASRFEGLIFAHRLQRWPSIKPASGQPIVLVGKETAVTAHLSTEQLLLLVFSELVWKNPEIFLYEP